MTMTPEDSHPGRSGEGADAALLARLLRYQDILTDFSRLAGDAKDLAGLRHLTCLQAARGTGIGHAKLMRYRPAIGDLLIEAGVGWKPGVVGSVTLGADVASLSGRTLMTRLPTVVDDLPNDPEFRYSPILRDHGIVSALNVPVTVAGTVWGVLEVDSETPRHFSDADVKFLTSMANILGMAVQHRLAEARSEDAAARMLRETEQQRTLMRELVHRDKNDFQMIMALLLMQKRKQRDAEAIRGFAHVMDRVSAISMAHDQLAMRPDQPTIDVAAYLQALCGNLEHRSEHVRIRPALVSAELSHERAVSLGLITNELVTNAIKHAFPDGKGTVRVEFTTDPAVGEGCLTVADDGVGMGPPRPGSSGMQLTNGLARQIGGTIERIPSERGTTFQLRFLMVK
ncbi:histidine kinase dimerization/phosphoacceptor domain -containing protein [Azospirillum sp. SYSU D00513]|uniref:sensor histidine kinase n=1 Tax=Azospirillum sp. SYSU D00513 TaxID=2812561 RepID=UPI001A958ADE|nr:histidine kinase dimerization/phosphoacceptor domain -containing protein [Azospirillum sp. SYSU D00513]